MFKRLGYRFRNFDLTIRNYGSNAFTWSALFHYGLRALIRPIRQGKIVRTPQHVMKIYDTAAREEYWTGNPSNISLHDLVDGDSQTPKFILYRDRIIEGTDAQVSHFILNALAQRIEQYLPDNSVNMPYIVEFGSGTGRNIMFLKQRFPEVGFIGLELSPDNVAFANSNARRYGIDVQFYQANICSKLPTLPETVVVAFSCHALEQIPRVFPAAVENMISCAKRAVLFYEPCCELYPRNLRGLISQLRIINADYIRGLYPYLTSKGYEIAEARRLGTAVNPFNETCEIVVVKD